MTAYKLLIDQIEDVDKRISIINNYRSTHIPEHKRNDMLDRLRCAYNEIDQALLILEDYEDHEGKTLKEHDQCERQ